MGSKNCCLERCEPGSEGKGCRVGVGVETARAQVTSTRPASDRDLVFDFILMAS